jgi:hypothetical protein
MESERRDETRRDTEIAQLRKGSNMKSICALSGLSEYAVINVPFAFAIQPGYFF